MRLQSLDQISRKRDDHHIYYRNDYTAVAKLIGLDGKTYSKRIEFSVELSPTGKREIRVQFLEKPDYPVLHLIKSVKEEIQELYRRGELL